MFNDRVETGTLDLSELAQHWQLLDAAYDAVRHVTAKRRPEILHARMIDEGQVAGHRVYMAAQRYLMIARDNHQALVALLQSPHGLSVSAPWNLLRGTFEASFYAAWVLDPEESLERRRRALRLEIADEREQALYYDDLLKVFGEDLEADPAAAKQDFDQAARDVDTTYRAEAQELGLTYPPPGPKVLHGLAELSCATELEHGALAYKAVWRGLSGLAHGHVGAYLRASDKLGTQPRQGGVTALLSVNDGYFLSLAGCTNSLHLEALRLLLLRSQP